ncbi:MAG TPA: AzlD domain-containing protein [Candidatus Limnocylindrales bacterium]|jgi:branched-subunit amino acid transport protein
MTDDLVILALLMGAVTYPWRAVALLAPGFDRLPTLATEYLRLVGPAVLAALAAVAILVVSVEPAGQQLNVGIELVGVVIGVVIVRWRRNVFLGILAAVLIVAIVRLLGG